MDVTITSSQTGGFTAANFLLLRRSRFVQSPAGLNRNSQRNVSANTIASYRDTFRLLFTFAQARLRKPPSALALGDLDAPFISAFLADLETKRRASVRTRNLRLTAIRSFFRFASFEEPAHSAVIQQASRYRASATISEDPNAKSYTDEALRSSDDYDHQEMYQLSDAARQAAAKAKRIEEHKHAHAATRAEAAE